MLKAQHLNRAQYKIDESAVPHKLSPFNGVYKGASVLVEIADDTVMRFRGMDMGQDVVTKKEAPFLFQNFNILSRSVDNLKFLVLSSQYDFYAKFNMQNGYVYAYIVDLNNRKIRIYTTNLNLQSVKQKMPAVADLDAKKQSLIIKGYQP